MLNKLAINYLPLDKLIPYSGNARTHSEDQIKEIVKSIKKHGWTNPILLDGKNEIIAGHGRLLAAKKLGLNEVPTIDLSFATDAQKAEYIIADNKLALNAGWDYDILNVQFDILEDAGIDITDTGFSEEELESIRNPDVLNEGLCDEDDVPGMDSEPITNSGDVWCLGKQRLMCGDSTMLNDIEKLMNGEKADMVFTDPPYGMNYSGRGKKTSEKIIGDDIDPTHFYNLLPEITERYIWGRVENYVNLTEKPRDVIIWKKNNFGMGSGYRGQYEVCFYYGDFKGSDSDVWEISKDASYEHPTQKPVALAERAIINSNPKIVIDLFGGSGSTLIACEKTNRKCFMMELSPTYCDVIIKRWQKFTGKQAILESTQQTFDEVSSG